VLARFSLPKKLFSFSSLNQTAVNAIALSMHLIAHLHFLRNRISWLRTAKLWVHSVLNTKFGLSLSLVFSAHKPVIELSFLEIEVPMVSQISLREKRERKENVRREY
jgi:hypothetical protein